MSLNHPMMYGPANPPRLPTELMRAIAPAAAVPLKKAVDKPQNGATALHRPETASASAASATPAGRGKLARNNPAEAHHTAAAKCTLRSALRSDERPCRIMTNTAKSGGTALMTPTSFGVAPGKACLMS